MPKNGILILKTVKNASDNKKFILHKGQKNHQAQCDLLSGLDFFTVIFVFKIYLIAGFKENTFPAPNIFLDEIYFKKENRVIAHVLLIINYNYSIIQRELIAKKLLENISILSAL